MLHAHQDEISRGTWFQLAQNIWLNYEGRRPQPENADGESERLGLGFNNLYENISLVY